MTHWIVVIVSAHNLPKASAQWGKYALGVSDVWDECNGLLRAQPFEKAYHANEIIIMFQPSSEYGKSDTRSCIELQQHTFGEYHDTDLLMPSGNMPSRRSRAAHAAISVTAQQHRLRSSLSFTTKDFDNVSNCDEKGTTAAWVQSGLAMAPTSGAISEESLHI
ncbi:hypothetical protein WJX77_002384 [Trebouxia sp. C0004]